MRFILKFIFLLCATQVFHDIISAQCPSGFVNARGGLNPLCDSTVLNWVTWSSVSATSGTGTISSGLSMTIDKPTGGLSTTGGMYNPTAFPTQYNVPVNSTALRNDLAGLFTFCFNTPVVNPQIALSSIGNSGNSVQVITSVPYVVIWNGISMSYPNNTTFIGAEGFTIIQFPGIHTCISFNYLNSETYCNMAFGVLDTNCQSLEPPPICPGGSDTLTASGAVSYTWSPATGLNTTTGALVVASPQVTTTYVVTGTDANNCTDVDSITVPVYLPPVVTVTGDTMLCAGESTTLTASGGVGYEWIPGNLAGPTVTFAPPSTVSGAVIVTSADGCEVTKPLTITVSPLPQALFSVNDVCQGTASVFTDGSAVTAPATFVSWDWDFGDGTPHGNTQNPTHTYAAANTYTVVLTVTTDGGCTDTYTTTALVNPLPVADFTFVNQCFGTPVPFTDASSVAAPSVISDWAWDFDGDMTPDDISSSPSFSFPSPGAYTVGLGVQSDAGCINAVTHSVTVYTLPIASFTAADECLNSVTGFVNTSTGNPDTWTWDFDDLSPADNTQSPSHTYAASGSYTVQLSIATADGCTDDTLDLVIIYPNPLADFSAADVCLTAPVLFSDNSSVAPSSSITNWDWDFEDNGSTDNTTQSPSFTYLVDGIYDVHLIVTATGGCVDDTIIPVTVFPGAVAGFSSSAVCKDVATDFTDQSIVTSGTIVSWDWDFGDSGQSAVQNPAHTYATDGTHTATLIVTSGNGCTSTFSAPVIVYPLPVAAFSGTSVCEGEPTVFDDNSTVTSGSISTWLWNFGDATVSSVQSPTHTYLTAGSYTARLNLVSSHGCLDSIENQVTVFPLPVVDFSADPADGCIPLDVSFTDLSSIASGSNTGWNWQIASLATSTQQNDSYTFLSPGSYDIGLTVTSSNGCTSSDTRSDFITVHPSPSAEFAASPAVTEILYPEISFIDLSGGSPVAWNWLFGTGDGSAEQSPVYSFPDTGIFNVGLEIANQFGCTDTVSHTVIILPSFTIYVPNAFTPDGNNVNDIFKPEGTGWSGYEFRVFSRWGPQVFESFNPAEGWDGTIRGKEPAPAGVYTWRIYVRDNHKRKQDFIGRVTLVR